MNEDALDLYDKFKGSDDDDDDDDDASDHDIKNKLKNIEIKPSK